jgi:hypothetical protein
MSILESDMACAGTVTMSTRELDRWEILSRVADSTRRLMELRFVVSESAFSYFASTKRHLGEHGKSVT